VAQSNEHSLMSIRNSVYLSTNHQGHINLCVLEQRLDHVKNWKGELEVKRSELENEIDATEVYINRIEKRIQSLQDNLHIAQTTLANR